MMKYILSRFFPVVLPSWIAPTIIVYIVGTFIAKQPELVHAGLVYIGPSSGIGALIAVVIEAKKQKV